MARIEAIDGLRALAMTVVILGHCFLFPVGWMGVWVFYVISGFVVCNSFHERMKRDPHDPSGVVRRFMFSRIMRIWPVYFLYITLAAIAFLIFAGEFRPGELIALFSFTYNWDKAYHFAGPGLDWPAFSHLWTISVEQQFYILFPLIYFLFIHKRMTFRGGLVLILLAPVVRYLTGYWGHAAGADVVQVADTVYASTFGHIDAFLLGALLARHRDTILGLKWSEAAVWGGTFLFAVAYCAVEIGLNVFVLHRSGMDIFKEVVFDALYGRMQEVFVYYLPVFFALAVIVSILKGSAFTKLLAWRPVVHIGRISYSGYVFHMAIIYLLVQALPIESAKELSIPGRLGLFVAVYGLTLVVADLSYRYIERPMAKLRPSPIQQSPSV